MGKINVLDFEIANLIAAGEVVERPSSVLKELIENSIDSGATKIVAEIKRGGVALIRVTDNGCGMDKDDLPVALKRHATSKIKTREDLDGILTLGFRGEALAAISSVSNVTIITRTANSEIGHMLTAEGGRIVDVSEVGTSEGTTVIVENLFFNVPARRKFLKRDSTEAMNVAALVEKVALSRPDIAIQLLIDGEERFSTPGNGKLYDTVYNVLGRDFASKIIEVDSISSGIHVHGYIGRSDNVRKNRNLQNYFINNRYVKSVTAMAATEKAFTSYIAPEAFPTCILFLDMNPQAVDVNVHPAKLEVKFANEQPVFEAIYHAVRAALEEHEYRPDLILAKNNKPEYNPIGAFNPTGQDTKGTQISLRETSNGALRVSSNAAVSPLSENRYRNSAPPTSYPRSERVGSEPSLYNPKSGNDTAFTPKDSLGLLKKYSNAKPAELSYNTKPREEAIEREAVQAEQSSVTEREALTNTAALPDYRIVGEAFDCYVFVEYEGALLVIDKHAAHERIIFEELKAKSESDGVVASQTLMLPISIDITPTEVSALEEGRDAIFAVGFSYVLSDSRVDITAIPDAVTAEGAEELIIRMADEIAEGRGDPLLTDKLRREKLLYQVACKAAIKGGRHYNSDIIKWLVEKVLSLPDITVCPHGRPIAFRLAKSEIDRRFERLK